jgi:hypothetical protein
MSELRDRLLDNIIDHWPDTWHGSTVQQLQAYTMADALIEELGLRRETTYAWRNSRTVPTGTRYVTEWTSSPGMRSAEKLGLTGDGE